MQMMTNYAQGLWGRGGELLSQNRVLLAAAVAFIGAALHLRPVLGVNLFDIGHQFFTLAMSIIIAAVPFLLLGVTLSALVAVFVDEQRLLRWLPKNRWGSHFVISLLGMFLPVCECGNIPLARRLMIKGFSASQAVTFLLAAPIINVVTIWSTWEAFRGDPIVLVSRLVAALVIANFVGILFSLRANQNDFLSDELQAMFVSSRSISLPKLKLFLDTFQQEFWQVFRMLVLGASIAAAIRVFVPDQVLLGLAGNPVVSILVMMLLGLLISICSSVDAFFALSFAGTFNLGAISAFLIFGPMIDVKILSMLKASFRTSTLVLLVTIVGLLAFISGLIVNLLI